MRSATTKTILAYIGANVRRLRERKGLTQEKLAEAADVDVRYLQRIERGTVNLSVDALVALAESLGVSPTSLFRPAKVTLPRVGRPAKNVKRSKQSLTKRSNG